VCPFSSYLTNSYTFLGTLTREKQIRHRISRSSTVGTIDSATSSPVPPPADLNTTKSAPSLVPSAPSSESGKRLSMSLVSNSRSSHRTLSESINLMGISSSSEPIRNLIIKYINVKFKSSRWSQRDCVVLRDVFSVSDGRCVLWEVSVCCPSDVEVRSARTSPSHTLSRCFTRHTHSTHTHTHRYNTRKYHNVMDS